MSINKETRRTRLLLKKDTVFIGTVLGQTNNRGLLPLFLKRLRESFCTIPAYSYGPLRLNYFVFDVPPWQRSGGGLYHGLWVSGTPSKHISVITTYMEMICALGLVVIMPQPTKYYHFGTSFFRDFLNSMILDKLSGYN
jgi:hypothetical protein